MFTHKQSRFLKSFPSPLPKFLDVTDSESFIREYILDNVFVCIFMYILFYFAIWYAHKVIKQIEMKNQEMLVVVEKNRLKLDDIIALKNKRTEYEEVVIKAKNTQKATTKQLDSEMKRLNAELVSTVNKINELEKFINKIIFSGNSGRAVRSDLIRNLQHSTESLQKAKKPRKISLGTLRYSNHRSRRRRHRSHRPENLESSPDHQMQLSSNRKSGSSSRASAETSSTESSYQDFVIVPKSLRRYYAGQGDRKWSSVKKSSSVKSTPFTSAERVIFKDYFAMRPVREPM